MKIPTLTPKTILTAALVTLSSLAIGTVSHASSLKSADLVCFNLLGKPNGTDPILRSIQNANDNTDYESFIIRSNVFLRPSTPVTISFRKEGPRGIFQGTYTLNPSSTISTDPDQNVYISDLRLNFTNKVTREVSELDNPGPVPYFNLINGETQVLTDDVVQGTVFASYLCTAGRASFDVVLPMLIRPFIIQGQARN